MIINEIFPKIIFQNDVIFEISALFDHKAVPLWQIEKRVIPDHMLVVGRSGTGYYEIEGKHYPVRPGRVFLISQGISHQAGQDESDPISVIAIRFSMRKGPLREEFSPKYAFVYDPVDRQTLEGIMIGLCRYIQRYTAPHVDMELCGGLLGAFFQVLHGDWNFYKNSRIYDTDMEKVNMVIDKSIRAGEAIELEYLLKELNVSRYEFSKRFRQYFKMTFRNYVFYKRISYAKELLQSTDFSVKRIALTAGYSDPYIFSNQFKRIYGTSPTQFRKKTQL